MVCPNCQKNDVAENEKICPRCGMDMPRFLTDKEKANILERSVLRGNIVELEKKTVKQGKRIGRLRNYIILLMFLIPISHCMFNRKPAEPTLSDISSETLFRLSQEQLKYTSRVVEDLIHSPDSTFFYVMEYGDIPEQLSLRFYGTRNFSDTIVNDNTIKNTRRIQTGDTLILRINPTQYIPNIQRLKEEQKKKMEEGTFKVRRHIYH